MSCNWEGGHHGGNVTEICLRFDCTNSVVPNSLGNYPWE